MGERLKVSSRGSSSDLAFSASLQSSFSTIWVHISLWVREKGLPQRELGSSQKVEIMPQLLEEQQKVKLQGRGEGKKHSGYFSLPLLNAKAKYSLLRKRRTSWLVKGDSG